MNKCAFALALALATCQMPLRSASADECLRVLDDGPTDAASPTAKVSGRITLYNKVPPGDLRSGDGPWLMLDRPLGASFGNSGCYKWKKIAVLTANSTPEEDDKLDSMAGQHVIIEGKLGHFTSGLVSPNVFIEIKTIKCPRCGTLPKREVRTWFECGNQHVTRDWDEKRGYTYRLQALYNDIQTDKQLLVKDFATIGEFLHYRGEKCFRAGRDTIECWLAR